MAHLATVALEMQFLWCCIPKSEDSDEQLLKLSLTVVQSAIVAYILHSVKFPGEFTK